MFKNPKVAVGMAIVALVAAALVVVSIFQTVHA